MRIAYICADPGIPVFGQKGCSIHVQEVIRAWLKLGIQVDLFATRIGGDPPPDLADVIVHRLPSIPKGEIAAREQAALSANLDLRIALENNGIFNLVYERYSLWSFTGMDYAKSMGIPGILEVNAPLIQEQAKHRGLVDRTLAEQVAQQVFSTASAIIAVSEEIKTYIESYPGVSKRVHIIANGVNPERFSCDIKLPLSIHPEPFTVGFVGTLKPWHGVSILVEAFDTLHQKYGNTRLLIVGDGPERDNLVTELSARELLEVTHFTGAVNPDKIPEFLAKMTVAVAPYPHQSDFYFSPLKVYEYMAAGLPVVASRIGQLRELIEDEINGLLCPPGDTVALATTLERLYHNPEWGKQLGKAARQTIQHHHTWDAIAKRLLEIAGMAEGAEGVGAGLTDNILHQTDNLTKPALLGEQGKPIGNDE
ncbi:MAG: glycosyltransferase family 4 protein [Coleofasciculus sp. D1-CHI-01]|uniref:glycosyltransferase family 4 protein n=1 Tax=Coleofasciculus sp. D1-CHI-01 TaxID=3068482 RepID=UPI0032F68B78